MDTIITCCTCRYLPNLRYIARLHEVDCAIMLDLAPLSHQNKNSFVSRNRICDKSGRLLWLSVPVLRKGIKFISEATVDSTNYNWVEKHIDSIAYTYRHHEKIADGFLDRLSQVLKTNNGSLVDLNMQSLQLILQVLELDDAKLIMQSEIMEQHSKEHRLDAAMLLDATGYVAGRVEIEVMNKTGCIEKMEHSGIQVYTSPELDQALLPVEEIEKYSCIHSICTVGPEKTRDIICRMQQFLRNHRLK